jgi:hypothetical protein
VAKLRREKGMALFRCNKCGFLQEPDESMVGQELSCPKCASPGKVFRTSFFVQALIKRHMEALNEIRELRDVSAQPQKNRCDTLQSIDIFNTDYFSSEAQHEKIIDWLRHKGCQIQISANSIDTTGFYDEIGSEIGKNLADYSALLDGIRWAYREKRPGCSIRFSKKSKKETQAILDFSQKLYDVTLISRRFHDTKENALQLSVQTAKNVQNFFNGGWLEWHALMILLGLCKQYRRDISCTRNIIVTFGNDEKFELDVFALIDSTPVCIECKIGEFRPYIEKAQILKKRLGFTDGNFVMCIAGQDAETLAGLSAMHKLAFVNESTLPQYLEDILERRNKRAP